MPPSREFKIEFDQDWKDALEAHLCLVAPVRIKQHLLPGHHKVKMKGRLHGLWESQTRTITIVTAVDLYQGSSLIHVKKDLLHTLLHEYRHAHQHDTWDPEVLLADAQLPYGMQICEKDAEEWADKNASEWGGLFRIRPVSGSRLGRLAAAEERAR